MVSATCAHCSSQFQYEKPGRGRARKYCSVKCRAAATQTPYAPRSQIGYADCVVCGRLFVQRNRKHAPRPCCSKRCKAVERKASAPQCSIDGCERPVLGRGLCPPHYSVWHRAQRKYEIVCGLCGNTAQVSRRTIRYCSSACAAIVGARASAVTQRARATERRIQRQLPVLYTGPEWVRPKREPVWVRTNRRLTSGQCRVCNAWFVSIHTVITCSDECQQAYHRQVRQQGKDRRRARKRGAFVENVYRKHVYERGGYRCHICRKKTDPTKQVPHPRAPTIDHLIPLAQGGTHEPANCATACFLCNAIKGDRGGGEQLRLIG